MSEPTPIRSYRRASAEEVRERVLFLTTALGEGLTRAQAIRLAMDTFQVSRRMAQLYVRRVQTMSDPLKFVMRVLTRMLHQPVRESPQPFQVPESLAHVAQSCAGETAPSL